MIEHRLKKRESFENENPRLKLLRNLDPMVCTFRGQMVLEQATAPFPQDQIISIPSIVLILQRAKQSDLSRQRDVWLMSALGSVRDHNASLKASFQLQIPALIQLVSFEDTLIMGSRRADGVVNNTRIHWAEGTLSEFISSWLPVGPLHRRRRRMVCVCLCVLCWVWFGGRSE